MYDFYDDMEGKKKKKRQGKKESMHQIFFPSKFTNKNYTKMQE